MELSDSKTSVKTLILTSKKGKAQEKSLPNQDIYYKSYRYYGELVLVPIITSPLYCLRIAKAGR